MGVEKQNFTSAEFSAPALYSAANFISTHNTNQTRTSINFSVPEMGSGSTADDPHARRKPKRQEVYYTSCLFGPLQTQGPPATEPDPISGTLIMVWCTLTKANVRGQVPQQSLC